MDDFILSNLNESKNEWSERLISILVPHIHEGIRSIYIEAIKLASKQNEPSKYLMTFQSLLCNIPNWNAVTLKEEMDRIVEKSGCSYISDLIACVHIIQLKILTCMKVNQKHKKMDISIPKLDLFIHGVYVHVARELYKNAYLFERNITSLQEQKNHRCIELIIRHCILKTMRDSIPTEQIVKAYLDESIEPVVEQEEIIVEKNDSLPPLPPHSTIPAVNAIPSTTSSAAATINADMMTQPLTSQFPSTQQSPSLIVTGNGNNNLPSQATANWSSPTLRSGEPLNIGISQTSNPESLFTESNPSFSSFYTGDSSTSMGGIKFDNNDYILNQDDEEVIIEAPKTDEYIQARNEINRQKSSSQYMSNDMNDEQDAIQIHTDKPVDLKDLDICEL
jgi:hypothetical protein